jgi:hypothetical protein
VIGVPELRIDEHLLPPNAPRLEGVLHRFTDRLFIAVAFGAVEISKSDIQGRLDRLPGRDSIRNQRSKSHGGDRARSVLERNPSRAKRIG